MVEELFEGWSEPMPITIPTGSTDVALLARECRLVGWSLRESTGAAIATADLYNGASGVGQLVATVGLGAGLSDTQHFAEGGIHCGRGLWFDHLSGSLYGCVWVRTRG